MKQSMIISNKRSIYGLSHELPNDFNPIQDGLFRGCSQMGGAFLAPSLKSATHIQKR